MFARVFATKITAAAANKDDVGREIRDPESPFFARPFGVVIFLIQLAGAFPGWLLLSAAAPGIARNFSAAASLVAW